jgi:amino acid permease
MTHPVHEQSPLLGPSERGYEAFPALPEEEMEQNGSVLTSYLGLMSTMVGAGILSLPSTMSAAHVVPSTLVLVSMAILSYAACVCITVAADVTGGAYSYETLSKRLCNHSQIWFVRVCTMLMLFGAVVMYMIIAVDMLEPFLPLSRPFICGAFALICFPLCLFDTIHALRYSNSMVILCVLYIVIVLCDHAFRIDKSSWVAAPTTISLYGIAYTIPIQALSFGMHLNVPRVYGELREKRSMECVTILLIVSGFFVYWIASYAGYVCFQGTRTIQREDR